MKKKLLYWVIPLTVLLIVVCLLPAKTQAEGVIVTNVEGLVLDDPALYDSEDAYEDASVERIIAFLELDGHPDWVKILRIHDFVCEFVEYDWEAAAANKGGQTAYEALTTGKVVCGGYARLTAQLLRAAGFRSKYISCEILNHAWNAVELNGVWYNMDTTWDDPDDPYYEVGYTYFLRCDENFGHSRGVLPEEEYSGYDGLTMAEKDFYCGNFGEDLYWVVSDDGTLTVYGDGTEITTNVSNDTHGQGNLAPVWDSLEHAIIPEGIVKMDGGYDIYQDIYRVGFTYCENMIDVHLPVSLTFIGENSFYRCDDLTDVYYAGSKEQWEQVQILDGNEALLDARIHFAVSSEPWNAPSGRCGDDLTWTVTEDRVLHICGTGKMYDYTEGQAPWHAYTNDIYEIVVEDGVSGIGNYAFDDCYRVMDFTVPDSVTVIGDYALAECRGLRTCTIPESVCSVGEGLFYGCKRLRDVELTGNIKHLSDRMFYDCEQLGEIKIPEGIVSIGDYCFYNATTPAEPLPGSLTSIGEYAFAYCALQNIVTSSNVTEIATGTFYGCTLMTRLEIPDYITTIGEYAFGNCDSLSAVIFPGTPIIVADHAFYGCNSLQNITLTGVSTIGEGSFSYANIKEIEIPDSVTAIGADAFSHCNKLESAVISGSVTRIGAYAFGQCPRLEKVVLSDGIQTIGDYAFSYCIGLTDVTLPDSLVSIGTQAFESCWDLENITLPKHLAVLGDGAFYSCELKSVTVPGSVKNLGTGVFASCDNLQSVVLEEGIVSIGNNAFGQCSSLSSIEMPKTLTYIDRSAFSYCTRLNSICIPTGVTTIGDYAFQSCRLTDVYYQGTENMWNRVEIGIQNSSLTGANMHFADGVEGVCNLTPSVYWFLSEDGELVIYGEGAVEAFGWDRNVVTSLTILPGVTSIGGGVFMYAKNLKQVQIADTVTSIDSFIYCSSLTAITIPDSVTQLDTFALAFCPELQEVTLPAGMKAIPEGLFTYCSALRKLVIPEGVTSIGDYAFDGCDYLSVVFFRGTKAARQSMNIGSDNGNLTSAVWHYEVEDAVLDGQDCYYCPECDGYFLPNGTQIQRYPVGDFTKDQQVTNEDVIYLLWHTLFPENYPVDVQADFTGDGQVTNEDVIYLLWHTLFPESYPLTDKKKLI